MRYTDIPEQVHTGTRARSNTYCVDAGRILVSLVNYSAVLEYTIASTIGLHHGNTAVLALGDPYVVARTWSGVVSNVIYDIGLIMSLVHQDTASSTGPFRVYDSLNRRSPKPCQSSRDSV